MWRYYSPATSVFFGGAGLSANLEGDLVAGAEGVARGGGAELQMSLLSRGLVAEGLRTAIIVWPVATGSRRRVPSRICVERPGYAGAGAGAKAKEARYIWRAMREADAQAYLFRGSGPQLMVGQAFCRLHRRKLIFSAASDLDFDFARPDRSRANLVAYQAAVRGADLIVVQRSEQGDLGASRGSRPDRAHPKLGGTRRSVGAKPEAFLWIGRLVDYKRPLEYLRLAESLPEVRFRMVWFATNETRPELTGELRRRRRAPAEPPAHRTGAAGRAARPDRPVDAVVSTSRAEGMPNTFLEAWSRGIPVVSLEFDPDGRIAANGLGEVARSADELRAAVSHVWSDAASRADMGRRAREQVMSLHSPAAVSNRWASVLRRTLRG